MENNTNNLSNEYTSSPLEVKATNFYEDQKCLSPSEYG